VIIEPERYYGVNYPFMVLNDVFTKDECKKIQDIGLNCILNDAKIGENESTFDPSIRKSKNSFIHLSEESSWIFNKLKEASEYINNMYFQYDLLGFSSIQYTEYDHNLSHYNWHMDLQLLKDINFSSLGLTRKLSASVILNSPADYSGGEFQMYTKPNGTAEHIVAQEQGSVIFFPSYALHRVSPVTEGIRKSLVLWIEGPKFK
jgi:PKHD-type hydroxylase